MSICSEGKDLHELYTVYLYTYIGIQIMQNVN